MSANICLAAFVFFCLPETKKVALEEMDELFGGASHVAKGAELIEVETTNLGSRSVNGTPVKRF